MNESHFGLDFIHCYTVEKDKQNIVDSSVSSIFKKLFSPPTQEKLSAQVP